MLLMSPSLHRVLEGVTTLYERIVRATVRHAALAVVVASGIVIGSVYLGIRLAPSSSRRSTKARSGSGRTCPRASRSRSRPRWRPGCAR